MKKKILLIIFLFIMVLIWGVIIYKFSDMNTLDSNGNSRNIINVFLERGLDFTNDLGITNSHPNETKIEHATNLLNSPLRKIMHASVYFVFSFFIMIFINIVSKDKKFTKSVIITIFLCLLFALTDEYHQTLVNGRTGSFLDVLIDTTGALIGTLFYGTYFIAYKIGKKSSDNKC